MNYSLYKEVENFVTISSFLQCICLVIVALLMFYFFLYQVDTWEVNPPQFNPDSYTKVISNLKPYVEYEFSIRLHTGSGPVRKEMWSKPVLKRIRTEASSKILYIYTCNR